MYMAERKVRSLTFREAKCVCCAYARVRINRESPTADPDIPSCSSGGATSKVRNAFFVHRLLERQDAT